MMKKDGINKMEDNKFIAYLEVSELWHQIIMLKIELMEQLSVKTITYEEYHERMSALEIKSDHLYYTMTLLDSKTGGK